MPAAVKRSTKCGNEVTMRSNPARRSCGGAGLASCPITEPLEIAETRAEVQADVFGAEAYPQMLLRIGWAPVNADPLPSTARRDLSEMATRLDGSPLI